MGSPPRMRGKGGALFPDVLEPGITPAYAGKRPCRLIFRCPGRDHPCVCGEKPDLFSVNRDGAGSPLRMRGKVMWKRGFELEEGITPAYAGKSKSGDLRRCRTRDHPRVCGEKRK